MKIDYYFKLGELEFNTKPNSPTIEKVINWYNEWVLHPASKDYTTYLVGSFAEMEFGVYDGRPYDVDIVLVGNIKDEVSLKSLLEYGIKCGFANDVMIDIWHNDKLIDLKTKKPFIQTRSYDTFIGSVTALGNTNTTNIPLWNGDGIELDSGLYQYVYDIDTESRSWNKANKRVLNGKYKEVQIDIKTIIK